VSVDLSEVSDFLACADAEHIIRAFSNLRGPVRNTFVAHLMAVASQQPVFLHVGHPTAHEPEQPQRVQQEEPRRPALEEPQRQPEPPREPERQSEGQKPPESQRQDGFFSESREMRVIERRLRGESINAIRLAESMPYNDVKVMLEAAEERGVPVSRAAIGAAKTVTPKLAVRKGKLKPLPPLPPEIRSEVRRVAVELRFLGHSPTAIAASLGVDVQMVQNAVWDALQKDPTMVRPEVNPDLPPLGENPLKALVLGARIAQGVSATSKQPEPQPELPLEQTASH
jgi:hypothetical protein